MTRPNGTSFYLFDFDDNIMFLPTPIFVLDTVSRKEKALGTGEFATVHPQLGKPGPWEDYALFDGSFRNFRDIPSGELAPGERQYFERDVERAVTAGGNAWQAPAWPVFAYACARQRPVSIVTARGHSVETLRAGVRVLAPLSSVAAIG